VTQPETAKQTWKRIWRSIRVARRESNKALHDTLLYGIGAVRYNGQGADPEHIPALHLVCAAERIAAPPITEIQFSTRGGKSAMMEVATAAYTRAHPDAVVARISGGQVRIERPVMRYRRLPK